MILTAFGMPDNHPATADISQHCSRDFPSVCTLGVDTDILSTDRNGRLFQDICHLGQIHIRNAYKHITICLRFRLNEQFLQQTAVAIKRAI